MRWGGLSLSRDAMAGEKCLGHRLPSCGPLAINGNLRATSTRYPWYGPPGTDTLVWPTNVRYQPPKPCHGTFYNTIPNYLNWIQFDQIQNTDEALQSADVRTRCTRLRARWRTGAPGGLRAPNSRTRPEAVHSRRESHQNRKDSNGGHALACASSQPARRRRPARGRSGSVVTIPPRGDKSWPLGSNGTCTVALTKRLDHMK